MCVWLKCVSGLSVCVFGQCVYVCTQVWPKCVVSVCVSGLSVCEVKVCVYVAQVCVCDPSICVA